MYSRGRTSDKERRASGVVLSCALFCSSRTHSASGICGPFSFSFSPSDQPVTTMTWLRSRKSYEQSFTVAAQGQIRHGLSVYPPCSVPHAGAGPLVHCLPADSSGPVRGRALRGARNSAPKRRRSSFDGFFEHAPRNKHRLAVALTSELRTGRGQPTRCPRNSRRDVIR